MKSLNILIIGAGPTGLTAALEFAKHGVKVDIVEKKETASTLSRAVGVLPVSLHKLGGEVAERMLAESIPFMKFNMHIDKKRILSLDFNGRVKPHEVITGLPQDRTEEIMRDALAEQGIVVQYGCAVSKVTTDEHQATVSFANDREDQKYDWVIACDGIGSLVRKQLGIDYLGYDLEEQWSIADVELNSMGEFLGNNVWMKIGKDNGAAVSLPIAQDRIRIISTNTKGINTIPVKLDIKKINREGLFTVSIRQAETYKKGRVLLAGDSAHCHSSVGGKGMNLGISDAVAAVKAIIEGTTDQYTSERHKEGANVIKESENMRKMIMSKNPILKVFIKTVFGILNRSSWLQGKAIKRISSL